MSLPHYVVAKALDDYPNRRWINVLVAFSKHRVWVDNMTSTSKSDNALHEPPIVYAVRIAKFAQFEQVKAIRGY